MKKAIIILIIFLIGALSSIAQITYSGKVESAFLNYRNTTIQVEAGPNWKGYNLNEQQNGVDLNLINGVRIGKHLFAGLGLGYLNFEGIHGVSMFTDFEYTPLKSYLSPLINVKIGYNHIWNQYENGKQSALVEFGGGLKYTFNDRNIFHLQSGLLITQQTFIIPIRIGLAR